MNGRYANPSSNKENIFTSSTAKAPFGKSGSKSKFGPVLNNTRSLSKNTLMPSKGKNHQPNSCQNTSSGFHNQGCDCDLGSMLNQMMEIKDKIENMEHYCKNSFIVPEGETEKLNHGGSARPIMTKVYNKNIDRRRSA